MTSQGSYSRCCNPFWNTWCHVMDQSPESPAPRQFLEAMIPHLCLPPKVKNTQSLNYGSSSGSIWASDLSALFSIRGCVNLRQWMTPLWASSGDGSKFHSSQKNEGLTFRILNVADAGWCRSIVLLVPPSFSRWSLASVFFQCVALRRSDCRQPVATLGARFGEAAMIDLPVTLWFFNVDHV